MSSIVYIAVALVVGLAAGVLAGPSIRLFVSQIVSDAKAEYEKEKTVLIADKTAVENELASLKTSSAAIITDLKTEAAAAEAKVAAFVSLFPTQPQIQTVIPAPAPVPEVVAAITPTALIV
jgi:hypothetical protein